MEKLHHSRNLNWMIASCVPETWHCRRTFQRAATSSLSVGVFVSGRHTFVNHGYVACGRFRKGGAAVRFTGLVSCVLALCCSCHVCCLLDWSGCAKHGLWALRLRFCVLPTCSKQSNSLGQGRVGAENDTAVSLALVLLSALQRLGPCGRYPADPMLLAASLARHHDRAVPLAPRPLLPDVACTGSPPAPPSQPSPVTLATSAATLAGAATPTRRSASMRPAVSQP